MMTKKSEMAEWILDFFRQANVGAGQIILFRIIQNRLLELNPKERDLFVGVFNELIENGYFTYEEGSPQCLRLTAKGGDYIYNPEARLDCCHDQRKPTKAQSQYLANWHDSFINYIRSMLSAIATFEATPTIVEDDKKGLEELRLVLLGPDVQEIEKDLADGNVKKSTIEKIVKLNKQIVDICMEHIQTSPLEREFWKQMAYLKIENDKNSELMRLGELRIQLEEA
jgi:hypothetical protein